MGCVACFCFFGWFACQNAQGKPSNAMRHVTGKTVYFLFFFFCRPYSILFPNHNIMSVSIFTNALRTQSRLRVMTAARVALPATRSISIQAAFRTAVPKNVSFSVSRLFTTSHVARYESEYSAPKNPPSPTIFVANIPWNTTEEELSEIFTDFGEVRAVRIRTFFFSFFCPFFS